MPIDPRATNFIADLNKEIKKWILPETALPKIEIRVITAKSHVNELSEIWAEVVRQRTLVTDSVMHLKLIASNIRGILSSAGDGTVLGQSLLRSKMDFDRMIKLCETYVDSYREHLESLKIAHEYYRSMSYLLGARVTDV